MENILQLNRLIKEEIIMEQNDVINDINENQRIRETLFRAELLIIK